VVVEWAGRLLGGGVGMLVFLPIVVPLAVVAGLVPGCVACFLIRLLAECRPVSTFEAMMVGIASAALFGPLFACSPCLQGATLVMAWCGARVVLIAIWVGSRLNKRQDDMAFACCVARGTSATLPVPQLLRFPLAALPGKLLLSH
jgi:hypothetical protein